MISLKKNSSQQGREAGQLKRNIFASLTLASGLLFFSGGVSAANELTLTQLAGGLGGPFEVTEISGGQLQGQDGFITFCVEQEETVSNGHTYDYELSTVVKEKGTNSPTTLNSKTAQLYSMFRDGTLEGVAGFSSSVDASLEELQKAIWHTEGYDAYSSLSLMAKGLVNYVNPSLPNSTAWTLGLGNVRVINLTRTIDGITTNYQSQLATVPIPAAAWLFGSGLIGLAAITRKKKMA